MKTILVVDDAPAVQKVVQEFLEMSGYAVLTAANGAEGLAVAEGHAGPIHLLITDVRMPRLSGPDLARHLADRRPVMKVVYMSGYVEGAGAEGGGLPQDRPLIRKPFMLDDLLRVVQAVLDPLRSSSPSPRPTLS